MELGPLIITLQFFCSRMRTCWDI